MTILPSHVLTVQNVSQGLAAIQRPAFTCALCTDGLNHFPLILPCVNIYQSLLQKSRTA